MPRSRPPYPAEFRNQISPDGLVGDGDPALCEQILHITKTEEELMIGPDGVADDYGRKAVATVLEFAPIHPLSVPNRGLT